MNRAAFQVALGVLMVAMGQVALQSVGPIVYVEIVAGACLVFVGTRNLRGGK